MNSPVIRAFFIGRALAEVLRERIEAAITDTTSQVGKAFTEFQETWSLIGEDVLARAERDHSQLDTVKSSPIQSDDLQATLDDLRAEVAQLRSELQKYRSQSS